MLVADGVSQSDLACAATATVPKQAAIRPLVADLNAIGTHPQQDCWPGRFGNDDVVCKDSHPDALLLTND
ncbi:MAG: hypothetical protein ACRCZF_13895 [Gemmataceae bacterium]